MDDTRDAAPTPGNLGGLDTLGQGWSASAPQLGDVDDLVALLAAQQQVNTGRASATYADIATAVVGRGAAVRRHLVVRDPDRLARGWATVHDRAAGRVVLDVTVHPDCSGRTADALAAALFHWGEDRALVIAKERGLDETQIDSGAFAGDERQRHWLRQEGFTHTRTWFQMTRAVTATEADPGVLPAPRDGVTIRRVGQGQDGLPDEDDLRVVHDVLETSFADHFNSYAESFDEFVSRLREDPGHRWDHWWLAELDVDDGRAAAGALVASALPGSTRAGERPSSGSYVDYIGVLPSARGRGVAKALLHAVIADAAQRGRHRVGLEVDADSPTGAASLYTSMGWSTSYATESWHRDIPVGTAS